MKSLKFLDQFIPQILDGSKTMTRRVITPQPTHLYPAGVPRRVVLEGGPSDVIRCPYGQPGDCLHVDGRPDIVLEIVSLRVERLQAISEADAKSEGVIEHQTLRPGSRACNVGGGPMHACGPVPVFRGLWESIYDAASWAANPLVWVIAFRRIAP